MEPPLDNQTEFEAHPQLILTRTGERLLVMVKATFELPSGERTLVVAPEERTRPLRFADMPWDDDKPSSILYPADVCPFKPGTDVIVVAKAYPPPGEPVTSFDAMVQVGVLEKAVKVYGLRVWEESGTGLSGPRTATAVELRYENAWGGSDASDPDHLLEEPRNPVGLGVARDPGTLTHQQAPCIEDPAHPLHSCRTSPPPAGMGALGRHWEPRRRYLGTYDAVWKAMRAPLPPEDEDDRLHRCASPGLWSEIPLPGGQPVKLLNLVPGGGATEFTLPRTRLEIEFRVRDRETEVKRPDLDTVLIDTLLMEAGLPLSVELVWRSSVKAPRRMEDASITIRDLSKEA